MSRLSEDYCEPGLFTIKFHFVDHLCYDLETFCRIKFKDAAFHEHFEVFKEACAIELLGGEQFESDRHPPLSSPL